MDRAWNGFMSKKNPRNGGGDHCGEPVGHDNPLSVSVRWTAPRWEGAW